MSQRKLSFDMPYIPDSLFTPLSPVLETEPQNPSALRIKEYDLLRNAYLSGQVSNTRQQILRKMARKSFLLSKMDFSKSYYLYNWVADILLMTELELLYWGILLQNTGISDRYMRPRCILLLTGYLSKLGLCEEIEPYQDFLLSKFPNFTRDFEGWALGTDCYAEFSIHEANRFMMTMLSDRRKKRDYEDLVSSVLKRANNRDANKSDTSTEEDQDLIESLEQEYAFLPNIFI